MLTAVVAKHMLVCLLGSFWRPHILLPSHSYSRGTDCVSLFEFVGDIEMPYTCCLSDDVRQKGDIGSGLCKIILKRNGGITQIIPIASSISSLSCTFAIKCLKCFDFDAASI